MRVVFDTNIYVSAFVLPGSSADRAMQRILDGHDTLLISKPILEDCLTTMKGGDTVSLLPSEQAALAADRTH